MFGKVQLLGNLESVIKSLESVIKCHKHKNKQIHVLAIIPMAAEELQHQHSLK